MKGNKWLYLAVIIIILSVLLVSLFIKQPEQPKPALSLEDIPPFSEDAFVILNNNQPNFTPDDLKTGSYEFYSKLDRLGRCGYAVACVGKELMPTEDREEISSVTPSGIRMFLGLVPTWAASLPWICR